MSADTRLLTRQWQRDAFSISTDPALLDVDAIHEFLRVAYWSRGIPRDLVARSIESSLNFGLYQAGRQIGFARVVSDYATFAWLGDVFVVHPCRGQGLSKWLMECILAHPGLQGLRRIMLATRDAQGLYARFGFAAPADPATLMQLVDLDLYARAAAKP